MIALRRLASFGVLALGVVVWTWTYVAGSWDEPADDLASIYRAGELLEQDRADELYHHDPTHFERVAPRDPRHPFVHVPLVAVLGRAVQPLGFTTFSRIALFVDLAAFALGAALLARRYLPGLVHRPWAIGAALLALCGFEPLRYAIALGQTTPLIFLGLVVAITSRRDGLAGGALAAVAFVKLAPVVVVALFVAERRWRAVGWFVAVVAALTVVSVAAVGVDAHLAYLATVRRIAALGLAAFNNQSITGFWLRHHLPMDAMLDWRVHEVPVWLRLASTLSLLATAVACAVSVQRRRLDRDLAGAFLVLALLILPPIVWSHYHVHALIPLAILLARVEATSQRGAHLALGTAAALMMRPLAMAEKPFAPDANLFVSNGLIAAVLLAVVAGWLTARQLRSD